MNIYFGGSIAGGRQYLATYQQIVAYLKSCGHRVLTEHVVKPDVFEWEKDFTAEQIYTRDIQWLNECDCMIAEVSNPSLGVGYEICYALRINKPVLCLYRKGIFLTRMLIGNTSDGLLVKEYQEDRELEEIIDMFLGKRKVKNESIYFA
ncbi:MAG: deoxyribonucleoside 5'-monophosphate N-glycosidase [Candidatus Aminicenantes bacterium]|nr:deoxyribonucleoside 5'-monophosphate N-glycosidase [Candidatus Aminicenantes bacterium]NIM80245.1 deoxyribonucleoside 5'-monophosphate N-glycosidase [Candidatus Aminicenantes bacterium]NIN19595.1 deoxyribonucleoside 5'-monophosphate N-glycosidase [Candidatus Aminicenantes bacterium]NIN43479.1 deoxyribonucleoside 5'-monophosphate N-glycosidase [Candidatus Aminicenantes bacterium]NIN86224.1 deoxyribonucleoside 5'-monophosphate N-glycosidase [Candidatus Aminicenantes bacterium]